MCGSAGIYSDASVDANLRDIERMLAELSRRGPDDSGVETWPGAGLGHKRLSIFDLSPAGHQPMMSEDRVIGVVFNGAIYNFHTLRSELVLRGHKFRSRTDTEVLINGYREWGIDGLLSCIDGMFAFGLWDNQSKRLFLVRDRLGVKPLAFCVNGDELLFASTVRALSKLRDFPLNDIAVAEFLEFGFVTDDHSIYKGIDKVQAGEIVEWSGGQLRRR